MSPRLTHIALRATDLQRSVAFYAKYAGLVVAHERDEDGTRVVWLAERAEDPEFVFVLIPMLEIAPDWVDPALGIRLADLVRRRPRAASVRWFARPRW